MKPIDFLRMNWIVKLFNQLDRSDQKYIAERLTAEANREPPKKRRIRRRKAT